ncbi:hypothetical protein MA16_Dca017813 [Dendrobium catenatum]|uniref:Uncharacterized protein n=1 Tax=Dendrobium catenatum TaxID=906689 RepID=A0A2I0VFA3_9ASPA|nr:hypothetical protein MA16_Dca017813 [Dendrobium catenatum]
MVKVTEQEVIVEDQPRHDSESEINIPSGVSILKESSNNRFSLLSSQVEEGEIVPEFTIEDQVTEGPPDKTITGSSSIITPLIHCSEDESITVKKKKSKQLKNLGPISSNLRSRRMEMEAKGTLGIQSPITH